MLRGNQIVFLEFGSRKLGVPLELLLGSQGISHVALRDVRPPLSRCEGNLGITLDCLQGTRSSS